MNDLTASLQHGRELSISDVEEAVRHLVSSRVLDTDKAQFLAALRQKGETPTEIAAFAQALLTHAVDPEIDLAQLQGPMLDICGTGGDKMELFNVSTTSMFVLAAGGVTVVKHGNRAITSKCGGADVLEELGVPITLTPDDLRRCVRTAGLGFIFAPNYHPAFKAIAPARKLLAGQGTATIFNILGPLLNPARPPFQLIGVFSSPLLDRISQTLFRLGRERAWVYTGRTVNGESLDEISISGPTEIREVTRAQALENSISGPEAFGLPRAEIAELRGGDRRENAEMLVAILTGTERGAKRDIVALNAAAGFVVAGISKDIAAGLDRAFTQIDSGAALKKLRALQSFR